MTDIRLIEWMGSNDTGSSSLTIALWLSGRVKRAWPMTPADPSDLGRCLRLLDRIPEWKERMPEMAECCPQWAAMVPYWDEISASMESEVGIDWSKGQSAPLTYNLMKRKEREAREHAV